MSQKSDKVAQHLSAFSNLQAGGFLVFGVSDQGVRETGYTEIIKKLGNIARESLTPSVAIDHSIVSYDGVATQHGAEQYLIIASAAGSFIALKSNSFPLSSLSL